MDLMLVPALLVMAFAATIGVLWLMTGGRFKYLLALAAGFGLFGSAMVLQFFALPPVLSTTFYVSGFTLLSYGLLARSGEHALPAPLALLAFLIIAGVAFFAYVDDNVQARAYVLTFGLGIILLYPLWSLRHLMRGTPGDRGLFWAILIVGLHFFPRALLTVPSLSAADAVQLTSTLFWTAAVYAGTAFTLLLGLTIMFATALDVVDILQKDRDTDPLTGIYNRRGLDLRLEQILADPRKRPVSLLIGDIDHFKVVNDKWGHLVGDKVLQSFVQTLKESSRAGDVVSRIGGEEFVLVVPRAKLANAHALAERIRANAEHKDLDDIAEGLRVTCSLGVVEIRAGEGPWEAIGRADALLYIAKQSGRNRAISELSPEAQHLASAPPASQHVRQSVPPSPKSDTGPVIH